MSHWEYYGEDQHRPDIKIILKDILSNTEDTRAYQRFNLILSEIERLEEEAKVAEEVEELREEVASLELILQEKQDKLDTIKEMVNDLTKEFKE